MASKLLHNSNVIFKEKKLLNKPLELCWIVTSYKRVACNDDDVFTFSSLFYIYLAMIFHKVAEVVFLGYIMNTKKITRLF